MWSLRAYCHLRLLCQLHLLKCSPRNSVPPSSLVRLHAQSKQHEGRCHGLADIMSCNPGAVWESSMVQGHRTRLVPGLRVPQPHSCPSPFLLPSQEAALAVHIPWDLPRSSASIVRRHRPGPDPHEAVLGLNLKKETIMESESSMC